MDRMWKPHLHPHLAEPKHSLSTTFWGAISMLCFFFPERISFIFRQAEKKKKKTKEIFRWLPYLSLVYCPFLCAAISTCFGHDVCVSSFFLFHFPVGLWGRRFVQHSCFFPFFFAMRKTRDHLPYTETNEKLRLKHWKLKKNKLWNEQKKTVIHFHRPKPCAVWSSSLSSKDYGLVWSSVSQAHRRYTYSMVTLSFISRLLTVDIAIRSPSLTSKFLSTWTLFALAHLLRWFCRKEDDRRPQLARY